MRSTMTAVLERETTIRAEFHTEPYELPWANEARFFVQVHELTGQLEFSTEISPDGLHWCPLDHNRHLVDSTGLHSWAVREFGQWLRLRCRISGTDPTATVRIYLVGKS